MTRETWATPEFGAAIGSSLRFVSYETESQTIGEPDILGANYPLRPIQVRNTDRVATQDFSIPFGQGIGTDAYVVFLRLTVKNNVASVAFRHPRTPWTDIAKAR